uniref:Nucleosome assembly protein n=1 Tax=Favella ehrenbergii TaxID=182087 RepID=A0A7S3I5S4_9SPIT|eukprot:CAMPEP_0170469510 /NCGR_PEP_ID=MMETSP0123-20130129/12312_1 /TAXON_ID=182087 /ORGANISM="Favella ehrenbergii, Strain Fehren 1" /LENGTH=382 /DNA_ID=CAMNT_0010736395 /DNA_START=28 /DNA_END=1176 /DNA_ORIENTATION=-
MAEDNTAAAQATTDAATEDAPLFPVSKQEREMEQKMVKVISRMPENVQKRFQSLYVFSDERSKINDQFEKEVRELSEAYEKRKLPILQKRDAILAGTNTEFDDSCIEFDTTFAKLETAVAGIVKTDDEKEADAEEEKAHEPTNVEHLKEKPGVPDFWSKAIKNHAMLQSVITEKDAPILEHLTNLNCSQVKLPSPKLTVTMTFSENEFMTNETLSFTAVADNDTDQTIEVIGTVIEWKEGQDPTKKKVKKTQKNKKTGEKRVIVKSIACDSFFNLFESKKEPEGIHDKDEDDLDSDDDKVMQQLEEAHDISNDLYDLYTVDALEFYLGFGPEIDGLLDGEGPESGEDSDDDAAEPKVGGKKAGGEGQGKVGPDGKPEDCKQQ